MKKRIKPDEWRDGDWTQDIILNKDEDDYYDEEDDED